MEKIGHAISAKTLIITYLLLLGMAVVMIGLSQVDVKLIPWNTFWDYALVKTLCIMGMGTLMAVAIVLVLMGLGWDHKYINHTIFAANFFFLLIFILFTWVDTAFRGEAEASFAHNIDASWTSPVKIDSVAHHEHAE